MKDGQVIDDTGRFNFGEDGNNRSFEIPAAIVTDSGVYTVEANNSKGNSVWTFVLHVNVSASPCADVDVAKLIESAQEAEQAEPQEATQEPESAPEAPSESDTVQE